MVYLPPRGNFVDRICLEAQCLARILQHVSPLATETASSTRISFQCIEELFQYIEL